MAVNGKQSLSMSSDCAVHLIADSGSVDSIDGSDSEPWKHQQNGNDQGRYVKLGENQHVFDGRETYVTRRHAYYFVAAASVIFLIFFILIIVGSVKIDKLQAHHDNLHYSSVPHSAYTDQGSQRIPPASTARTLVNRIDNSNTDSYDDKVKRLDETFQERANCSIVWVDVNVANGLTIRSKVTGGAASFFVIRSKHLNGLIPGEASTFINKASVDYQGSFIIKSEYQALSAPNTCVEWIKPEENDEFPSNAVPGGFQPITGEVLYICLTESGGLSYFGWIRADRKVCHFASTDEDATSTDYKVLIAAVK